MVKCKNTGKLIKRNSKIISLHVMLPAHMFRVHRGSLRTRYAHAYESARIFLRPRKRAMTKSLFKIN